MLGLMQDRPLLISQIIDFAGRYYPDVEIVSRTVEGPIHRYGYKDAAKRARFYPATPDPLPDGTVYSLPEFDAATVPGARLISCPGCYPTAAMLSLLLIEVRGAALAPSRPGS